MCVRMYVRTCVFDQLTRIVAHGVLDEDLGRIRSRVLWAWGMAEMRLA